MLRFLFVSEDLFVLMLIMYDDILTFVMEADC